MQFAWPWIAAPQLGYRLFFTDRALGFRYTAKLALEPTAPLGKPDGRPEVWINPVILRLGGYPVTFKRFRHIETSAADNGSWIFPLHTFYRRPSLKKDCTG